VKIGILGAGLMSEALGGHWVRAGHDVLVGARNADRAAATAAKIGARAGTLEQAARFGDVVLLAVKRDGLDSILEQAGATRGSLSGKTLVDCGNAVELSDYTQVTWDGRSMAEQVQRIAVGSHVVKAFNLCHHDVWRLPEARFDGRPLTVPIAGDDAAAKRQVAELAAALGGEALDVGELTQARHLEAMAIVVIRLLFGGAHPLTVLNLVRPEAA
jgi:8-hydroxy-5-deazaflavin:NADPH oxidoreductase